MNNCAATRMERKIRKTSNDCAEAPPLINQIKQKKQFSHGYNLLLYLKTELLTFKRLFIFL